MLLISSSVRGTLHCYGVILWLGFFE